MSEEEIRQELVRQLVPGASVHLFYNTGNINNRLYHLRAVVDEEWYVLRWWSRRQGWRYTVEHLTFFEVSRDRITIRQPRPLAAPTGADD